MAGKASVDHDHPWRFQINAEKLPTTINDKKFAIAGPIRGLNVKITLQDRSDSSGIKAENRKFASHHAPPLSLMAIVVSRILGVAQADQPGRE